MTQLIILGPFLLIYVIGLGAVRVFAMGEVREQRRLREKRTEHSDEIEAVPEEPQGRDMREEPSGQDVAGNGGLAGEGDLVDTGILEIVYALIEGLRKNALKLFIIFLVVTSAAFYWLIYGGIEMIRDQTLRYMDPDISSQVSTVQLEVFEFVFLVVKYSLFIGILAIIPFLLYYSRDVLKREGIIKGGRRWPLYILSFIVLSLLFIGGVMYAYFGMVPVLVSTLSGGIVESGMIASFTVSDFINFVVLVSVLFGFMALLPAVMYILVSTRAVRYETLRDKWRHFCIAVFGLGAVVTSPDPFTMVIVSVPLVGFYIVSLGVTRVLCHRTIKKVRKERKRLGLAD